MSLFYKQYIHLYILSMVFALTSCLPNQSAIKRTGNIVDFSKGTGLLYCSGSTPFFTISQPNVCSSACPDGTHLASIDELAKAKQDAITQNNTDLLNQINNSLKICIDDNTSITRPTNAIDIKGDFCSCVNGKSDIISNCDAFCAGMPNNNTPTLYLNTIIGPEIANNATLKDLNGWCNTLLPGDTTQPQCYLSASDGTTTYNNIAVSVQGNSLSANINVLALDRTWIIKIIEGESGSNAQSKEIQIRRKAQSTSSTTPVVGALKVSPVNQYSCLQYGGTVDNAGNILRTNYVRNFYYYAANETPPPMPPSAPGTQSTIVCHDEQAHPGNDSVMYPRLELYPQHFALWDRTDSRFVVTENKSAINRTIESRMFSEYGISQTMDLFKLVEYPNRPMLPTSSTSTSKIPMGYMMVPFTDPISGNTLCPTSNEYNSGVPLYTILRDYLNDTEGLYLAEKEAEIIVNGNGAPQTIYGTMFVTESVVKQYGFYIENGLKIKADQASMNTKTIHFYWPLNIVDPMTQAGRKLYTIRTYDTLSGTVPNGIQTSVRPTDKRIGCVPKSSSL